MDEYILETEHLHKKYKKHEVIKDVSVKIKKGKIYGLIGENGAGKSTFMRLVTGLSLPDEGNIKRKLYRGTGRAQYSDAVAHKRGNQPALPYRKDCSVVWYISVYLSVRGTASAPDPELYDL